jgi:predicted peptidase
MIGRRVTAGVAMLLATLVAAGCVPNSAAPSETGAEPSTPAGSEVPSASESSGDDVRSNDFFEPRYAETTDSPLGYWEYLPPSYADPGPSPLLVFLHGFGENGNGSQAELIRVPATGIPQMVRFDQWSVDLPFVVLAPQHATPVDPEDIPDEDFFTVECAWQDEVAAFIDYALATYDVDPARVYLTGLSCGAYGAWMYLAENGNAQIAAMVPIAGPADEAWAAAGCELGVVPIWAFHGDADDVVPISTQSVPVGELSACPSPPREDVEFTAYPGVDHDSWTRTYDGSAGHDIYAWMLDHSLSE